MPIYYSKEKKEWFLKDMEQEELDFLIELGKEQFIRNLSVAMINQIAAKELNAEELFLNAMPTDKMGQA